MLSPNGIPAWGNANLDTRIFNNWDGIGAPGRSLVRKCGCGCKGVSFEQSERPVSAGPGGYVSPAILERGFAPYYLAPGYDVLNRALRKEIEARQVYGRGAAPSGLFRNPYDARYGTIGSWGMDAGYGSRFFRSQAGAYSME